MQFKLNSDPLNANHPRIRTEPQPARRRLSLAVSCISLLVGVWGCHSPAQQPAESDQVQFVAAYMTAAENLLNQGYSDRDAATLALSSTIDTYRAGAFRAQAPTWQPHVSVETLPDGARRIAIRLKEPNEYAKSEVFHLSQHAATQGDPKPLTR